MHQHRNPNLQHSIHHQHLHHNDNSIQTAFIQTAPCQSPGHNPHATHSQHEQSLISQQESSMLTDSPQHFETQHLHIGLNETIQSSYQNGSLVGSNSDRVISSSSPSSSLPMISSSNATIVSNRTLTPIIAQPIQMPSSIGGNSFFNSSTSGTSPPPLTPNGLLSGLHSFLFADSVGLVDPFGIDGNVDISSCLNSSNGNTFFSTSSSSIETEQGSNAGGNNHSTNADLTASALRLPPFCSIWSKSAIYEILFIFLSLSLSFFLSLPLSFDCFLKLIWKHLVYFFFNSLLIIYFFFFNFYYFVEFSPLCPPSMFAWLIFCFCYSNFIPFPFWLMPFLKQEKKQ